MHRLLPQTKGVIEQIEWAPLPGERGRLAGANARLGNHGKTFSLGLARVTLAGDVGFGWSNCSLEQAKALVGTSVGVESDTHLKGGLECLEFPLLDWWGRVASEPVYRLLTPEAVRSPLEVPCYDTSLLFDDLHLASDKEAVKLIQAEAREGWEQGHRAFKLKVGRGAMHMPLEEGTARDIAVILGVREAVGPDARLMIDANNGYNLNLVKRVLRETAEADIYWLEEPFHEDAELFQVLKTWLREQNLGVMLADGEGFASPRLIDWAESGWLDVVQYDIRDYGFVRWLELGRRLDAAGVKSAPHNYGGPYGNYVSGHLAPAIHGFQFVEWDGGEVSGLDASSYVVSEGKVHVPSNPGFGLTLDDAYFSRRVKEAGWSVEL